MYLKKTIDRWIFHEQHVYNDPAHNALVASIRSYSRAISLNGLWHVPWPFKVLDKLRFIAFLFEGSNYSRKYPGKESPFYCVIKVLNQSCKIISLCCGVYRNVCYWRSQYNVFHSNKTIIMYYAALFEEKVCEFPFLYRNKA